MTVGEITTTRPHAVKVFQRHGIDFCCGGGKSLAEACQARGIDADALLAEISAEETRWITTERRWDQATPAELIDHLLTRYHAPLKEELPRLEAMAERVMLVHGAKDERLEELYEVVVALRADLARHLVTEERSLFPAIREGRGAAAAITELHGEHESVGALLGRARHLTDAYVTPEGACGTWRALWSGLAAFDQDLREHIALENNVLFPRALGVARLGN